MRIKERFHTWNKCFRESEKNKKLAAYLRGTERSLRDFFRSTGKENQFYFSDDCMVIFRNLGFLADGKFNKAAGELTYPLDGRPWRLWVLCWGLNSSYTKNSRIVDIGTYNGEAMLIALKYALLKGSIDSDAHINLYDIFENPPIEAKKAEHGPELAEKVKYKFRTFRNTSVHKGDAIHHLKKLDEKDISFCQIDLNSSEADARAFQTIYSKLSKGPIIIFDDYGFARYEDTQLQLDKVLYKLNPKARILEPPTGQGLYFHNY